MAASGIACPGCGAAVPYGRLSCPDCGELLASVAGGRRPAGWATPESADGRAAVAVEERVEPDPPADDQSAPTDRPPIPDAAVPSDGGDHDWWWSHDAPAGPAATPIADDGNGRFVGSPPGAGALPWAPTDIRGRGGADMEGWGATPTEDPVAWTGPDGPTETPPLEVIEAVGLDDDPPLDAEEPLLEPEPEPYPARPGATWPGATWPGASPPEIGSARAADPEGGPSASPVATLPTAGFEPSRAPGGSAPAIGRASGGPSSPVDPWTRAGLSTPDTQERIVAIGGGIATIAFFLPWGSTVIGAPALGQPWDSIGIVGAWHIGAFLAVVATVAISQARSRVAPWVRLGVVPLAAAGFLVGLDWPYLGSRIGGGIGAYLLVAGALALAAAALLALRAATKPIGRNAETRSSV